MANESPFAEIEKQLGVVTKRFEEWRVDMEDLSTLADKRANRLEREFLSVITGEDADMYAEAIELLTNINRTTEQALQQDASALWGKIFFKMHSRTVELPLELFRSHSSKLTVGEFGFGERYHRQSRRIDSWIEIQHVVKRAEAVAKAMRELQGTTIKPYFIDMFERYVKVTSCLVVQDNDKNPYPFSRLCTECVFSLQKGIVIPLMKEDEGMPHLVIAEQLVMVTDNGLGIPNIALRWEQEGYRGHNEWRFNVFEDIEKSSSNKAERLIQIIMYMQIRRELGDLLGKLHVQFDERVKFGLEFKEKLRTEFAREMLLLNL